MKRSGSDNMQEEPVTKKCQLDDLKNFRIEKLTPSLVSSVKGTSRNYQPEIIRPLGGAMFECLKCGDRFSHAAAFQQHSRKHYPHSCESCCRSKTKVILPAEPPPVETDVVAKVPVPRKPVKSIDVQSTTTFSRATTATAEHPPVETEKGAKLPVPRKVPKIKDVQSKTDTAEQRPIEEKRIAKLPIPILTPKIIYVPSNKATHTVQPPKEVQPVLKLPIPRLKRKITPFRPKNPLGCASTDTSNNDEYPDDHIVAAENVNIPVQLFQTDKTQGKAGCLQLLKCKICNFFFERQNKYREHYILYHEGGENSKYNKELKKQNIAKKPEDDSLKNVEMVENASIEGLAADPSGGVSIEVDAEGVTACTREITALEKKENTNNNSSGDIAKETENLEETQQGSQNSDTKELKSDEHLNDISEIEVESATTKCHNLIAETPAEGVVGLQRSVEEAEKQEASHKSDIKESENDEHSNDIPEMEAEPETAKCQDLIAEVPTEKVAGLHNCVEEAEKQEGLVQTTYDFAILEKEGSSFDTKTQVYTNRETPDIAYCTDSKYSTDVCETDDGSKNSDHIEVNEENISQLSKTDTESCSNEKQTSNISMLEQ